VSRPLPIYYLNVEGWTERLQFMERQFADLQLPVQRIAGVTPADVTPADLARYCDPRRYFWLTLVEFALNLSHLRAMRAFLDTGADFAAIFEDDAVLSRSLPTFLSAFAEAQPAFDLVKLETFGQPVRLARGAEAEIAGVRLRRPRDYSAGSAGYIVSRRAAETILSRDDMRRMASDEAMFNPFRPLARELRMVIADPGLCMQADRLPDRREAALASRVGEARQTRAQIEAEHRWQRLPWRVVLILDRDIRMGVQKTWHQKVGGAKKQTVAFKAD